MKKQMKVVKNKHSNSYDVVVVGGGTAGVIAAVQSARAGVRTLLIEKTEILGGTITSARVFSPGLFHAWGKQIIRGIGWELVERCVRENGDALPCFDPWHIEKHWTAQIPINPYLYALLCEEALADADCDVLYHAMLTGVEEAEKEKILSVAKKEGISEIRARVVIDCTGDANVIRLAGYEVERADEPQPATYICRLSGYDLDAIDLPSLALAYDAEVAKGNLRYTDIGWNTAAFDPMMLQKHGDNANHVPDTGEEYDTSVGRSSLAREGRLALLRLYRFLRGRKGFDRLRIDDLASECGVRESVRIVGKERMEIGDFLSGKMADDAVCYAFYPVDLHRLDDVGLENVYMKEGVVPSVPRGALLPKNSKNLLVAGRCVCSDQLVNSAVRVEAACMAMGQAAGAIAALAVRNCTDVEAVPIEQIHALLRRHDAIVPKKT